MYSRWNALDATQQKRETMNRRTFQNRPLSNEELIQVAPSAFAAEPWHAQSSRYTFIPTSRVIEGMRNAGFMPYNAIQSRTRIPGKSDYTKHLIRFRPQNVQLANLGDTAVEVVLVNSHDGSSRYELSAGAFRLACLNGLMVAESLIEAIKIRHTGNIISEVIDATRRILDRAPIVADTINRWKAINLAPAEARILAEEAHSLRFEEGSPVEPTRLLQPRRREDNGTDLWTTFNRIQENTIAGGLRTYTQPTHDENGRYVPARRNSTRAVVGIAENTKLNRALWSLGEKMAALKS